MNNLHKHSKGSALSTSLWALLIAVLAIYLLIKLILSGTQISPEEATDIATNTRIKPVGVLMKGDGIPEGQRTGEQVFNKVCLQCHAADSTVANSPKFGNTAEWAPRIAKGLDTLLTHVIDGFNAMPARGGASSLTDEELTRAIAYMANSAGANFEAPPVETEEATEEGSASNEENTDTATSEEATEVTEEPTTTE